jgi:Fur family iron response transcriptional regulator
MDRHPQRPSQLEADGVAGRLEAHGIVPTRQRIQVAAVLLAKPQHLSAEQLLRLVNRDGEKVSKATIYNTLGLFVRKGLVREVVVDRAKVFYDSNVGDHYHVYDMDEGTLRDIDKEKVDVSGLPKPPAGTVVDGVDVIVRVRRQRS